MKALFNPLNLLLVVSILVTSTRASGQVVVDGKNVNTEKEITYIQFLYFMEKSTFKPVYLIDYGLIENQKNAPKKQKIQMGQIEIKDTMSPVYILNLLHKHGWEYMGDETYVHVPMMEDWYSFTLKRKK